MGFLDFLGPIGGLIGGIGNVLGGVLGSGSQNRANDQSAELARENMAMQKEFAQHGIRWKAEDSRAAGIHPVFGMGAATSSFSPVSATFNAPDSSWIGNAGQNIGRALAATSDIFQRKEQNKNNALKETLTLENMGLQNDLVRSQINLSNARLAGAVGPPFPMHGQGSPGGGSTGDVVTHPTLGVYEMKPNEVTTANIASRDVAAGTPIPQTQWGVGGGGRLQSNPHKEWVQDQELTNPAYIRWQLTQGWRKPPQNLWPKGAMDMQWTPLGWEPVYGGGSSGRFIGGSRPRGQIRDAIRGYGMLYGRPLRSTYYED